MAEDRGVDVADTSGSYGGYGEGRDQGTGITGNSVIDSLLGIVPGVGLAQNMVGFLDFLAGQSWGNGIAGRGSSNDFTEGGGASTGLNDDARGIENIINVLLNRQNPTTPTTTPRVPRGGTEGGRRPSGGSMRSQYMPQYRGVSAGRNRRPVVDDLGVPDDGIAYVGGSRWFDESTGQRRPGAPPLGPDQKGYVPQVGGSSAGRLSNRNNSSSSALSALASFMPQAQQAASERAVPVTSYLDKLIGRGDIAQDSASINAAASPRLQKGFNTALSSVMMGNRVPDNIYDISGLGADIGGRQGAQNVNVRGRAPSRTRRF